MKRSLCTLLRLLLRLMSAHAENYVVLSSADNTIVKERSEDEKQSVVPTSRITTTVVAIEHGQLDESLVVGDEINKAYGSSVHPEQGQQVTMRDLLYGLMLRDGDDAMAGITKHVADSQEASVELINHKAAKIRISNTTLPNPSGLGEEDRGNISAANDMMVLMSYAMESKKFRTITSSKYYTIDWNMRWKNKNRLLFDYPFTVGRKIDFTKKAGRTLMSAAEHDGIESIVITL